jgi:hypothetical protein
MNKKGGVWGWAFSLFGWWWIVMPIVNIIDGNFSWWFILVILGGIILVILGKSLFNEEKENKLIEKVGNQLVIEEAVKKGVKEALEERDKKRKKKK